MNVLPIDLILYSIFSWLGIGTYAKARIASKSLSRRWPSQRLRIEFESRAGLALWDRPRFATLDGECKLYCIDRLIADVDECVREYMRNLQLPMKGGVLIKWTLERQSGSHGVPLTSRSTNLKTWWVMEGLASSPEMSTLMTTRDILANGWLGHKYCRLQFLFSVDETQDIGFDTAGETAVDKPPLIILPPFRSVAVSSCTRTPAGLGMVDILVTMQVQI
jgi:hypothetical protein